MAKDLGLWRERTHRWFRQWKSTLPAILMGVVLFLVCMNVGGRNVSSVGMVFLFYLRGLWSRHLSFKAYTVDFLTVSVSALVGVAATLNYPLCLVLNAAWMLLVTIWYGDDFQPRSSFRRSMWKRNSITAQRSTAASTLSRIVMIPFGTCMKSMMIIDEKMEHGMTIRTFSTGADRGNASAFPAASEG